MLESKRLATIDLGPIKLQPRWVIDSIVIVQASHVPGWYTEELAGVAAGAGLEVRDVAAANFLPELFHCSGFAVMNSASADGTLYHGRILDYACVWHLQDHAVLIVAEPSGGIPFVNVTFAGFIGSVTGMNAQHVSIGEMGGKGLGHWDGTPMAVLVRDIATSRRSRCGRRRVPHGNAHLPVFLCHRRWQNEPHPRSGGLMEQLRNDRAGRAASAAAKPVKDCVLLSAGSRYNEFAHKQRTNTASSTPRPPES